MMCSVKDWAPSFSYPAIVSSLRDADRTSTSPSPSTSIAKTDKAVSASVVMKCPSNDCEPSFSLHTMLSSKRSATSRSMEPSESTSIAKTARGELLWLTRRETQDCAA